MLQSMLNKDITIKSPVMVAVTSATIHEPEKRLRKLRRTVQHPDIFVLCAKAKDYMWRNCEMAKRSNRWSWEECRKIIKEHKDKTNWFNETISMDSMFNMLRYEMKFGAAEATIIIAALILAGARFSDNK